MELCMASPDYLIIWRPRIHPQTIGNHLLARFPFQDWLKERPDRLKSL